MTSSSASTSFNGGSSLCVLPRTPFECLLAAIDNDQGPEVGYRNLISATDYNPKDLLGCPLLKHVSNNDGCCPENCSGEDLCWKEVEWVQYPGRPGPVPMALCFNRDCSPRHEIKLEELMVWEMDLPEVARRVAKALSIPGPPAELIPTRLFRLGREPTQGIEVHLSRGELSSNQVPRVGLLLTFMFRWFRGTPTPQALTIRSLFEAFEPIHVDAWTPLPGILPRSVVDDMTWLTVTSAAELLMRDFPHLNLAKAKARVSAAAGRNAFRTNGKSRGLRRVEATSFDSWRLQVRDRQLDSDDE